MRGCSVFNSRAYSYLCVFVFMFFQSALAVEDVHLEDPTRPSDFVNTKTNPEDKVRPKNTFSLEAIVISDEYKVAIINEKILQVGDMIESKKVVSIDEEKVILSQEKNKDLVLRLSNISVKEVSK